MCFFVFISMSEHRRRNDGDAVVKVADAITSLCLFLFGVLAWVINFIWTLAFILGHRAARLLSDPRTHARLRESWNSASVSVRELLVSPSQTTVDSKGSFVKVHLSYYIF